MQEEITIYLDTSVPSAYFDTRSPERQQLTRTFWNTIQPGRVFISSVTVREIGMMKDPARREILLDLVAPFSVLPVSVESEKLALEYVINGIIPKRYRDDALHIAIATLARVNYLVSWNFDHLVKVRTREKVKALNTLRGYHLIEIIAPPEL